MSKCRAERKTTVGGSILDWAALQFQRAAKRLALSVWAIRGPVSWARSILWPKNINIFRPGSKRILPTTRAKKKRTSRAELNAPSGHVMNSLNANFSSYTCAKKDHLHKYANRNHRSERCFWNFWNRTNSREVRAVKPSLQERYKKLSQDLVQSQSWNPDELAQNSI